MCYLYKAKDGEIMAFSPKQYAHDQKYLKENIKLVNFSLNRRKPEDMEMLEWLNSREEGISAYVKSLIRRDMYPEQK